MSSMTKRERVQAALRGDEVDRPPVGFWGHDFLREWTPEGLSAAMLDSVRTYDYDYLKINPRASYFVEAWGCQFGTPDDPTRAPKLTEWLLNDASDLAKIEPIAGDAGAFGEHLRSLRMIADGLDGQVPFTQTVFSPLSVVGRMAADRKLVRRSMDEAPDLLHGALPGAGPRDAARGRVQLVRRAWRTGRHASGLARRAALGPQSGPA